MEIAISVVIPTYNREALLNKTLQALTRQTLDKRFFEVIVVDDGGSDNTGQLCQDYQDCLNIRYYWQYDNGFRAGKARNIGITAAEGDYIVLIDSGVLLRQDALEKHLGIHRKSRTPGVCIGYVYGFEMPDAMLADLDAFIRAEDVGASVNFFKEMKAEDIRQQQYNELGYNISSWPAPFDIFWTCHVSAERQALIKAGLFDEDFNGWGGEDVDLGVRLFLQNNRFIVDREICSVHCPHQNRLRTIKTNRKLPARKFIRNISSGRPLFMAAIWAKASFR